MLIFNELFYIIYILYIYIFLSKNIGLIHNKLKLKNSKKNIKNNLII